MLNKLVGFVCSVRTAVTAFVVSLFVGIPLLASAQTPSEITLSVPEINYSGVATQLMAALVPVLLAAIGIGLSIMIVLFVYHMFRRLVRG